MHIIWAAIWSFLLGLMISYVIPSMTGDHFKLENGLLLGGVFTVFSLVIFFLMPEGDKKEDPTH